MKKDELQVEETKTISEWATRMNIRLLDEKYYEDQNKYTITEYQELIPREIEVPLINTLKGNDVLENFARGILPENFVRDYKKLQKQKQMIEEQEQKIKEQLIEMFEKTPNLEKNYVSVDGLRFTYVKSTNKKSVDTKKLEEEYPNIYKRCLRESPVKSQIRTKIDY